MNAKKGSQSKNQQTEGRIDIKTRAARGDSKTKDRNTATKLCSVLNDNEPIQRMMTRSGIWYYRALSAVVLSFSCKLLVLLVDVSPALLLVWG